MEYDDTDYIIKALVVHDCRVKRCNTDMIIISGKFTKFTMLVYERREKNKNK